MGKADTALQQHQDISGKADKVNNATNGNFAGLDANGNLTNSTYKAGDFATAEQGAKADTAIQGVKKGGNLLPPDADKIVDVPVDIASAHATTVSYTQPASATIDQDKILQIEIPQGTPGHNPNLGTYTINTTASEPVTYPSDAPTTGIQSGDYIIVIDEGASPVTGTIWTWDSVNSQWVDTTRDANDACFNSGELLSDVKIIKNFSGGAEDVANAETVKIVNEKIEGVVVPDVYTLGGVSGYISFDPISIADDGDYFEFELLPDETVNSTLSSSFATLTREGSNEKRAICVRYGGVVSVANSSGSWILGMNGGTSEYYTGIVFNKKVKIKLLKDGNDLKFFLDDVLKYTATNALTSATIAIDKIGAGYVNSDTPVYWKGVIYSFKYSHGGTTKNIYELDGYSVTGDVTYTTREDGSGLRQKMADLQNEMEGLQNDMESLQGEVDGVFSTAQRAVATSVDDIDDVVKFAGYNASYDSSIVGIQFTANEGFDTYYFYNDDDLIAWIPDNGTSYIAISVIEDAQSFSDNKILGSSGYRKRKSDSNLPTEANPVEIPSGSAIAITVTAGAVVNFCNKETYKTFNGDIPLAESHVQQVIASIEGKTCYVDVKNSQLHIMIPSRTGYVKYLFVRNTEPNNHLDMWRVDRALKCDGTGESVIEITTDGAWESAIKIMDRDDFMGNIHGDEILSSINCFVDGNPLDITQIQNGVKFEELRILESTTMLDPADYETQSATHTMEFIFNAEGLVINQSITWLVNATLGASYMAMFPISQAVSTAYCTDKDFTPQAIPAGGANQVNIYGASNLNIWDATSGIFCTFGVTKLGKTEDGTRHLLIHNNGGTLYNKCYYFVAAVGYNDNVLANDVWKSTTIYKIMC